MTPAIYAPRAGKPRLTPLSRVAFGGAAVACALLLGMGAWLTPEPSGTGTHTSLGMQPCQFLARTHLPCPSCGMTTSVTYLTHGNLAASLWIQPMGTVIGLAAAAAFWICLYIAITGKPAFRLVRIVPVGYYVLPLMFFAIAAWGWKIMIHWSGLDGWGLR